MVLDYYVEESPYNFDLYFPRFRLGISFTNEVTRNPFQGSAVSGFFIRRSGGNGVGEKENQGQEQHQEEHLDPYDEHDPFATFPYHVPVGGHRLQLVHLRCKGYDMVTIPTRMWRDMNEDQRTAYTRALFEEMTKMDASSHSTITLQR